MFWLTIQYNNGSIRFYILQPNLPRTKVWGSVLT